jgi:hypothetical protein
MLITAYGVTVDTDEATCTSDTLTGKICGAHPGDRGTVFIGNSLDRDLPGGDIIPLVIVRCGTHVNYEGGDCIRLTRRAESAKYVTE